MRGRPWAPSQAPPARLAQQLPLRLAPWSCEEHVLPFSQVLWPVPAQQRGQRRPQPLPVDRLGDWLRGDGYVEQGCLIQWKWGFRCRPLGRVSFGGK